MHFSPQAYWCHKQCLSGLCNKSQNYHLQMPQLLLLPPLRRLLKVESGKAWQHGDHSNPPWMAQNLKEPKSQFSMSNQKSVRPRGKNDNSRKQADTSDSVASGPRAVFVDLSKI